MLRARVCERVPMSLCTRISASVRSSPPRALYFCVRLYSANPKGFIQCAGARPPGLCTSVYFSTGRAQTGFVRCEPTKTLCFCVLYEPQELCAVRACKGFVPLCTVRAPRALCGASLQRLYTMCWCSPPRLCTECLRARAFV